MRCSSGRVSCVYDESATLEAPDRPLATGSHLPPTTLSESQGGETTNRAEGQGVRQYPLRVMNMKC